MSSGDEALERTFNKAFCARTRTLREAAGLSRDEVARELGIDPGEYAEYETGDPLPAYLIEPFLTLVGATFDDLFQPEEQRGFGPQD